MEEKPANRTETGLFAPGKSGNPNGRPKIPDEFKEKLRANTLPALNVLISIMANESAKNQDRIRASEIVLDRAYGKAAQPIVGDDSFDPLKIESTELTKLIIQRAREINDTRPGT